MYIRSSDLYINRLNCEEYVHDFQKKKKNYSKFTSAILSLQIPATGRTRFSNKITDINSRNSPPKTSLTLKLINDQYHR